MCGLAGVVDLTGARLSDAVQAATLAALSHRGPDAEDRWQNGPCTLLHCRLRIIDLSPTADQPMTAARGETVSLVFNGEIYNYRALRSELERGGTKFTTNSDTEVLLQGYLAWGTEVFRRARGMWAVALYHHDSHRVVLARDPLGKKPLWYAARAGRLAFASNGTALLPLLETNPSIDPAAVDHYLAHLFVPFELSIYQGVHKVAPGTCLSWNPDGSIDIVRIWHIPDADPVGDVPQASEEIERLLRQAVRRRLESDVPLGVFLSAGFDSGLVAALAAQESGRTLIAVTAGTSGSGEDERSAAAAIARHCGLTHRPLEVPSFSAGQLPALLAELGEPFGDSSLLPTWEVARAARREMTVALTGDGGDEGFFGYGTFRGVDLASHYRRWTPAVVRQMLWRLSRGPTAPGAARRAGALLEYGREPLARSFRNRMGFAADQRAGLLIPHSTYAAEDIYRTRLERWSHLPDADALRRTLIETFLPNDYLVKVDTGTMHASLEARSPFLDIDLLDYVLRLPAAVAFPGGQPKALLRPLVRKLLPAEALNRPKTGFGVPVARWLRHDLLPAFDEFVFRPGSLPAALFHPEQVRGYLSEHARGADHASRLWGILAFGVWAAVVHERRWPVSDPLPLAAAAA